jgi:hypothetical protein
VSAIAEHRARGSVDDSRAGQRGESWREGEHVPGHRLSAEHRLARVAWAGVGPEDDVGVQHRNQRVEVSVPGGGQEGIRDLPLLARVGVRHGSLPDAAPGPAGEFPGRLRRAVHDQGDLLERDVEDVVQDEGEPLGGGQRLEHNQQGHADRVGQDGLLFRTFGLVGADHGFGQPGAGVVHAAGLARAEHVQADPPGHGGQPGPQVVDRRGVAAVQA